MVDFQSYCEKSALNVVSVLVILISIYYVFCFAYIEIFAPPWSLSLYGMDKCTDLVCGVALDMFPMNHLK